MEIRSHVNEYMEWWNAKSDFAWNRWNNAGRLADGPIKMMGGPYCKIRKYLPPNSNFT